MKDVALWRIIDNRPAALDISEIEFEKHLETWIENHPNLLEKGLVIVGRQFRTEAGPADLIAIDPLGRWIVIEIKPADLYRETFAQALDYAACLSKMRQEDLETKVNEYLHTRGQGEAANLAEILEKRGGSSSGSDGDDEREVGIYLVGTHSHHNLERLSDFLAARSELYLRAITFRVFSSPSGERTLVRELSDAETAVKPTSAKVSVESVLTRADKRGTGAWIRRILEVATNLGLYPRPFKTCIMFAPPKSKNRCLFTVWADPNPDGSLARFLSVEAWQQFYGFSTSETEQCLGPDGWHSLGAADIEDFVSGLRGLFAMEESDE